jgi:expansin (peptidoglycan-binding protein)
MGGGQGYGEVHTGEYDQGWVEWHGSYPNSCEPYTSALETTEGDFLVGVSSEVFGGGQLCDACIRIDTAMGKSVVARVITNGITKAPGNVDVSHAVWDAISLDEYPRSMTWQLAKCPDTGHIFYQFQTGAHEDWSSLWVRNPRVAVKAVEVKSTRHADFAPLQLANDGTYTDGGGFGAGSFTIRVTSLDDQVVTDTFPGFVGGDVLESSGQFQ